ncbi:crocagin A family RiPP precursor [Chondromyces crocatus]
MTSGNAGRFRVHASRAFIGANNPRRMTMKKTIKQISAGDRSKKGNIYW